MKATQVKPLLLVLLITPAIAYANAGLSIIIFLNAYAFLVGIIFVIAIEFFYLRKLGALFNHIDEVFGNEGCDHSLKITTAFFKELHSPL